MSHRFANLIIAASEADSNLYYACKFLVPDPIIYFEINGQKYLVLSDLEIDRARMQASAHHFISLSTIAKKIRRKKNQTDIPSYALVVDAIFKEKRIKSITVPTNFPAQYYFALKKLGYTLRIKPDPFFEKRLIKTKEEKNHIIRSVRQVEIALKELFIFLQKAKIKGGKIYAGREVITSELLKEKLNTRLMELGCIASHTIIASGVQGSYPHHEGTGPIKPHTPIIFDIFPRHSESRYWGDMTRTVVKGKPTDTVKKMFKAVLEANKRGQEMVKAGVSAKKIHETSAYCLEEHGFKTGKIDGRMQGFIHSTGHGLGLDIHELPSVSSIGPILKAGNVITIEPGLYYEKHGGIRLEDDLFVTKTGHETLTKFPKFLELDKG